MGSMKQEEDLGGSFNRIMMASSDGQRTQGSEFRL
jgi:hypothetical protein